MPHTHRLVLSSLPKESALIEVSRLTKTYGDVEAVRGVSFDVEAGEVFGFLGPNGAGKSTTISMLCTLVTPTTGIARVSGFDVVTQRDDVRRHIGLVFQDPTLDVYLTGEQNLRMHAELYDLDPKVIPARMRQMLDMVDLWDRRKQPVRTYSGGMRRRLEIARGLMHSPRVLFLDEPTIGLDPQTRSSIWTYIRALRESEGTTIFMTTHYMEEAEYCDRIAIMDRGEIVVLDTPAALKASVGKTASLDDVFMHYTGSEIRDGFATGMNVNREIMRAMTKGGR
jgi:ABC-2 type transport system ATP-binding protein